MSTTASLFTREPVSCPTDDLLERSRKMTAQEFSREFEGRVKSMSGFGPPLRQILGRIWKIFVTNR